MRLATGGQPPPPQAAGASQRGGHGQPASNQQDSEAAARLERTLVDSSQAVISITAPTSLEPQQQPQQPTTTQTLISLSSSSNTSSASPQSPSSLSGASSTSAATAAAPASRPLAEKVSFHLKTGIFTRRVTFDSDKMALGLIKQLAITFLNEIYFQTKYPPSSYIGDYIRKHFSGQDNVQSLYERIVLRIYNCNTNLFSQFNSVSDITQDSFLYIDISERAPAAAHLLPAQSGASLSASGAATANSAASGSNALQANSNQLQLSQSSNYKLKMAHDFHSETYYLPTHCHSCSTIIRGVYKQGFQCGQCKKNFCPKCKTKAELNGESCLAHTPSASLSGTSQAQGGATLLPGGHQNAPQSASNSNISAADDTSKLTEANYSSSTSKRKSASNLLHFNLANPFKSHHNPPTGAGQQQASGQGNQAAQQQQQQQSGRGSAGALDPVLQQLNKQKKAQQQQQVAGKQAAGGFDGSPPTSRQRKDSEGAKNNLLAVQAAQLSSSHQDLYKNDSVLKLGNLEISTGSSSLNQTPSKGSVRQLSSSSRSGAICGDSSSNLSPTARREQPSGGHVFMSLDWIQLSGEPTCGVCSKKLNHSAAAQSSSQRQHQPAAVCKNCKLQVHAHCQDLVLFDCFSRIAESSRAAATATNAAATGAAAAPDQATAERASLKGTTPSNLSRENIRLHRLAPSVKHVKRPDLTKPIIEGWLKHKTGSNEQLREHYWRLDDSDITLYENDESSRYFKAIPVSKIKNVISLPKVIKEDLVSGNNDTNNNNGSGAQTSGGGGAANNGQYRPRSAGTSPAKTSETLSQMKAMFAFELETGSVIFVQAKDELEARRWKGSLEAITTARRTPQKAARAAAAAEEAKIAEQSTGSGETKLAADGQQQARPQPDGGPLLVAPVHEADKSAGQAAAAAAGGDKQKQPTRHHHHHHHHHHPATSGGGGYRGGQHKTYTDPNRSRLYNRPRVTIHLDAMMVPNHLVEGKYLIERDRSGGKGFEELGSGQFGKVYAAISEIKAEDTAKGLWTGVPVAIKEISKSRFDLRQQEKLKNEATILSRLDHPGVIILERVHELPDKLYIVMEQLEDDMLEMIVSQKRLNERITKFLTYQILEALKYLHAQNIAHCDLKPENVLLVERRSQFPQIKLCDFGFAKIIEDNSFRSSLVGTPAYLAPEVVKGERYNRSVDLWSVGVIVYVSLSGEFPFNEGENIHDQISRANFMYPDQPWAKISQQAKDFINSLLRVNSDKRLSASRAQLDTWIQDFQLWCDLCELELRVGRRWVTDDADYDRWTRFAKSKNLSIPRSAEQLHKSLAGD